MKAAAKGCWVQRQARPFTATIHAAAATTGVGAWLLLQPSAALAGQGLSATTVEAYQTCPLKFKLLRDWQIPGPVSAAMFYGNIVHQVLRDFHQAWQAGRPRSEGEVLQRFGALLAEAPFDDEFQRVLYQKQGAQQLSAFLACQAQQPPPAILHVERDFQIKIDGVLVRGRMDRVDRLGERRIRILDFKTGAAYTQQKADDSLQLTLYAIAARQAWGAEPQELMIYNLEDNSQIVTPRTEVQLQEARDKVRQVAEGIKAGNFDPTPGFHCRWCEYRNLCPATEQKLYSIERAAGAN
jgi:DNA helicase-2/ATP-dependent DNA helicase PcrA